VRFESEVNEYLSNFGNALCQLPKTYRLGRVGSEDKGNNLLRKIRKYPPIGNEPYPRRLELNYK
jgi:hypothetical protein